MHIARLVLHVMKSDISFLKDAGAEARCPALDLALPFCDLGCLGNISMSQYTETLSISLILR